MLAYSLMSATIPCLQPVLKKFQTGGMELSLLHSRTSGDTTARATGYSSISNEHNGIYEMQNLSVR